MNGLSKLKIATYLIALFLAGGVTGWFLGARTAANKMFRPPPWEKIVEDEQERLQTALNLTPEQTAKLQAILVKNSAEIRGLFDSHMKSVKSAVRQRNAQITAILNPEQKKEFERIEKERQEAWRKKQAGRGRHGSRSSQELRGTNGPSGTQVPYGDLFRTSAPPPLTNSPQVP